MPRIESEISIDSPIDEVFGYLTVPANHVEIMPSLIEIDNVTDLSEGGTEGTFTFKMLGARLDGKFRDTELDPPRRRVYELTGDIEGTMTYSLVDENGTTHVTLVNDAEAPGPEFLETLTDPLVKRYLTREMNSMAENLKMIIEET